MDPLYPCKTCEHHYEDHMIGLGCAICWADQGLRRVESHSDTFGGLICKLFIGDNFKYLEEKQKEQE